MIEKLIPREKPKLLPIPSAEKPQVSTTTATTALSPDSIDASTSSSATPTPAPQNSAIQALIGKKMKPLPPAHLETTIEKKEVIEEKKKDSPMSPISPDEDTSEIKTPPMSPRSPVAPPTPTVLELKPPSKPLTSNFTHSFHGILSIDF
jgi:hypothetical protein